MVWFWHAAYLPFKSQSEIAQAVQRTIETGTRGMLSLRDEPGRYISSQFLFCVSNSQQNTIVFWAKQEPFYRYMFEAERLSGIVFTGSDKLNGKDADNSWSLMIWDKGNMTSWHVSSPSFHFSRWGPRSLVEIVLPYLKSKGRIRETESYDTSDLLDFTLQHQDAFYAEIESIQRYVKPTVTSSELQQWLLSRSAIEALGRLPQIFTLPFGGPEYHIFDIATYLDIQRGVLSPPQDLHYLDFEIQNRYERAAAWMENVSKFIPSVFTPTESMTPLEMLDNFAELFSYD